jgi:hypothetical protein
MKKSKKDRAIIQRVKIKSRDIELEIKEHIHALIDKKEMNKKSKEIGVQILKDLHS